MRLTLCALAVMGWSCSLIAGEAFVGYGSRPLTIDDAVQLALKQNPSILEQIQQLKAQKGLVFQAQARLLPQLTAATNYSQQGNELTPKVSGTSKVDLLAIPAGQPLTFANVVPVPASAASVSSSNQTWQVTLTVSQLIWDGGATIASRREARINEDAAYYTLRDTIDTVVETVRTQFYQILLNKALVQVQEESVNLLQSQLEDQRSRYEAGTVPQFNVLQAEGTLENQIPQLIAAQNNYRISQATLARTLGIPAGLQYTTDNPLPIQGTLTYTPIQYDLGTALIEARANRPFLNGLPSLLM
jgi:outer membrane protein TolC